MKNAGKKIAAFKILLWTLMLFFGAGTSRAATLTVNQAGDAGDGVCDATCTLRDAVIAANNSSSSDAINFAAGISNVVLTNEIIIANNGALDINGSGANVLTIDGGAGTNRIFYINQDAIVSINDVKLTGGEGGGANNNGAGGAIFADRCRLTLNRVWVTGNNTPNGFGGGIDFFGGSASGAHVINNSTFSDNTSGAPGQCACSGGAIYVIFAGVNISNSTFSGNTTNAYGGAVYLQSAGVTLRNSTITANTATGVGSITGGISLSGGSSLDFGNSIIAGNVSGSRPEIDKSAQNATVISVGYNLVGDSAGDAADTGNPINYQTTDILDTNPLLGQLQNNGGSMPTRALLTNSPAIDKGNATGNDQRGAARPIDFASIPNASGGNGADIGAFEAQQIPTAAAVSISGRIVNASRRGIANVRVRLTEADGITRTVLTGAFGYYRFADVDAGQNVILEVFSKRFAFADSTRLINVTEEITNANFVAAP